MFYEQLESLCKEKGTTPTAFVRDVLQLSTSKVTAWSKGSIPKIGVLNEIADYFGVTVGYLFDGKDANPNIRDKSELLDGYIDSYIAFIDILGFKDYVNKAPGKDVVNFFREIQEVSEKASMNFKSNFFTTEMLSKVSFNSFSDTIILSISKNEPVALNILIFMVNTVISNLLFSHQILIRGAITEGKFYNSDNIMFGPALNYAAILEHEVCKFPRIIIPKFLLEEYIETVKDNDDALERIKKYIAEDPIISSDKYLILNYPRYCVMRLSYLGNRVKIINNIKAEANDMLYNSDESIKKKWLYFLFFFNNELKKNEKFLDKEIFIPTKLTLDYLFDRTDNLQAHKGISAEISEDKQNLLEMFDQLHEDDKIRIITKMETIIEDYSEKAENAASRSTIFRAAKSADNHPSEIITTDKDFSKIPPTEIEL